MLDAARRGEFAVIVAYSNSRLTRRPLELETLIRLHDEHGTKIVTVVSGEDDLATADGRMLARVKASVDAAESERMGERVRRAKLELARQGKTNSTRRPFGWSEDRVRIDPAEAALIREAAERIIDGASTINVVRDWNERGVRTSQGAEWSASPLRRTLRLPRLAGYQAHRGEIVRDAAGAPVFGQWEPVLDVETWERLQEALAAATRGKTRQASRRYLLSGILRCGVCGRRTVGARMKGARSHLYRCNPTMGQRHHNSVIGPPTDELVTAVIKAHIAAGEPLPEIAPTRPDPTGDRLAIVGEQIAELMAAYRAGQLSAAVTFPQIEQLELERVELQAQHAEFIARTTGPAVASVEDFDGLDLDRQRAILETLLDYIVLAPSAGRGSRWTPDRLEYVWKTTK